jgi:hypothetical protein
VPGLPSATRGFGRRKPGPWGRVEWGHPQAVGLLACWPFGEGGSTTVRDAVGGRVGTAAGGITWAAGRLGWLCPGFDGTSGHISVPYSASVGTQVRACSFWFSPTSIPADAVAHRILACADGTVGNTWQVVLNPSNNTGTNNNSNLEANISLGGTITDKSVASTAPLYAVAAGAWYHVVVVWNSTPTIQQIYVNGQNQALTTQATTSLSVIATSGLVIGAKNDNTRWFPGKIDALALYSRQLTAADAVALYQAPFGFFAQPPPRRFFFGAGAAAPRPANPAAVLGHL